MFWKCLSEIVDGLLDHLLWGAVQSACGFVLRGQVCLWWTQQDSTKHERSRKWWFMVSLCLGQLILLTHVIQTVPKYSAKFNERPMAFLPQTSWQDTKNKTEGFFSNARAMAIRCFWPPENWDLYVQSKRSGTSQSLKLAKSEVYSRRHKMFCDTSRIWDWNWRNGLLN